MPSNYWHKLLSAVPYVDPNQYEVEKEMTAKQEKVKQEEAKSNKTSPQKEKKQRKAKKPAETFDFSKKNKVSVWVSQFPYADIPDEYFEEQFNAKKTRATNTWSKNFRMKNFDPENLETNGAHEGTVELIKAAGECSFSSSYIEKLNSKAKKKKIEKITWIVLLFEYEYSVKQSSVGKDQYLTFLGAFDYDDSAS